MTSAADNLPWQLDDRADKLGLWTVYHAGPAPRVSIVARNHLIEHYDGLAVRSASAAARRCGRRGRDLADDLLQEARIVLGELVEAFDPYRHPGVPFRMYVSQRLHKRLRSVLADWSFVGRYGLRKGYDAQLVNLGDDAPPPTEATPSEPAQALAERELWEHVQGCLLARCVSPESLTIVRMTWFEGRTSVDVAKALGLHDSRIRQRTPELAKHVAAAIAAAMELDGRCTQIFQNRYNGGIHA